MSIRIQFSLPGNTLSVLHKLRTHFSPAVFALSGLGMASPSTGHDRWLLDSKFASLEFQEQRNNSTDIIIVVRYPTLSLELYAIQLWMELLREIENGQ